MNNGYPNLSWVAGNVENQIRNAKCYIQINHRGSEVSKAEAKDATLFPLRPPPPRPSAEATGCSYPHGWG